MAHFTFRLRALQKLREHHRDQCREDLARVLAEDEALVAQRMELETSRVQTLEELQRRLQTQRVDVAYATALRQHVGQLQAQIRQVDRQRAEVAERLEACRQRLVAADQDVKVLEKLEEKQRAEHEQVAEAKSAREREEIWQAGRWTRR